MGAPVGLSIEAFDVDNPDLFDKIGDEIDLGANQVGVLEGDLTCHDDDLGWIPLHELAIQSALDVPPELDRNRIELEIHPGLAWRHVPTGHLGAEVAVDHARQCVEGSVGAHCHVAPFPVDHTFNRCSRIGEDRPYGNLMKRHSVLAKRIDDLHRTARPRDRPHIAGLASTTRIENGAIEEDPFVAHVYNGALRRRLICVYWSDLLGGCTTGHQSTTPVGSLIIALAKTAVRRPVRLDR